MKRYPFIVVISALFIGLSFTAAAQAKKIGPSGNPLPRFVSIAATKAFMRTGPGRQYPIDWEYNRKGLPMEIIDEYGPWRQVKDHEGTKGWMLVSLLSGKRTALIKKGTRKLFKEANTLSPATIIAEAGVIGYIEECNKIWCLLDIDGTEGWIQKTDLWGVYKDEVFD